MTWLNDARRAAVDRDLDHVDGIEEWTEYCRGELIRFWVDHRQVERVLRERAKVSRTREVHAPLRVVRDSTNRGVA